MTLDIFFKKVEIVVQQSFCNPNNGKNSYYTLGHDPPKKNWLGHHFVHINKNLFLWWTGFLTIFPKIQEPALCDLISQWQLAAVPKRSSGFWWGVNVLQVANPIWPQENCLVWSKACNPYTKLYPLIEMFYHS